MTIGGTVEIVLGIMFVFLIAPFLGMLGLPSIPFFSELAGVLVLNFGFLHIYAARDVKKFVIVPLASISLRLMAFALAVYNLYVTPALGTILIGAGSYDVGWSVIVLILLKRCNYI
jgi:hypothetical protein